jgi:hypothetical protein
VSSVRLFAILARSAPRAVIFRRGPSKRVLLVLWHTDRDEFEPGQWLKGRIYERRCDLSPSGERLVYFAATYKRRHAPGTWTAVSRPPWLTALALWPKGDAWGGGGLFDSEWVLSLNHRPDRSGGFPTESKLPRRLKVQPLGEHAGRGEDSPIYDLRLQRDGWQMDYPGKRREHKLGARVWIELDPPAVAIKPMPGMPRGRSIELRTILRGIHERNGAWYVIEHQLVDEKAGHDLDLGRTEWADWDKSGDLLFSRGGKLFRLPKKAVVALDVSPARQLADFSDLELEARVSPAGMREWL